MDAGTFELRAGRIEAASQSLAGLVVVLIALLKISCSICCWAWQSLQCKGTGGVSERRTLPSDRPSSTPAFEVALHRCKAMPATGRAQEIIKMNRRVLGRSGYGSKELVKIRMCPSCCSPALFTVSSLIDSHSGFLDQWWLEMDPTCSRHLRHAR